MERPIELTDAEQRQEAARGAAMGNPVCMFITLLDKVASSGSVRRRLPWWRRRTSIRILILAAIAALLVSGSRLL